MKNPLLTTLQRLPLIAFLTMGSLLTLPATVIFTRSADTPATPSTNSPIAGSTNFAPLLPAGTGAGPRTIISFNDDDSDSSKSKHHHSEADDALEDLVPIFGIVFSFTMPVLIVFFICYFRFRRRRENMALAREFLNKGLPIPPQLLDPSQNGTNYIDEGFVSRGRADTRKGFKIAFVGAAVLLALLVNDPHSRDWAWGLIPLVIGLGYLLSGWLELRQQPEMKDPRSTSFPVPPLDRP